MPILKVYDESTQSWVSIPSVQGETGAAAGFGTPTVSVDSTTGTPSATVTASGEDTSKVFSFAFSGLKGAKGDDGTTPTTTVTTITGGHNVAFSYGSGDPRNTDFNVMDGQDGSGIPTGGTTGQTLVKSSNTDYAVTWGDVHQVPSGGTQGQVLQKSSGTDYAVEWADQSGGDNVMCVNVTYASSTYSSDKTIDEILAAIGDGYDVFVKYSGTVYQLYSYVATSAIFAYVTLDYSSVYRYYITISKYNNTTRVVRNTTSFSKPTVRGQYYWEIKKENNTYYVNSYSDSLSVLDLYNGQSLGSAFVYLAEEGTETEHGQFGTSYADVYYFVKYWSSEYYVEDYEEWQPLDNAVFSKTEIVNGTLVEKSFTISYLPWDSTYLNVVYTETPISGGGGMVVTITRTGNTYTSDKTFAEIYAAYQNGQLNYACIAGDCYPLSFINSTTAVFAVSKVLNAKLIGTEGYSVSESGGNTYVSKLGNSPSATIPTVGCVPWSLGIEIQGQGQWAWSFPSFTVQELLNINKQAGFLNVYEYVSYAGDFYIDQDQFELSTLRAGERFDEDEQDNVPTAEFIFEKIKLVNGSLVCCTYSIYVSNVWTGWNTAQMTYTETPISGGASIQQSGSTLTIS